MIYTRNDVGGEKWCSAEYMATRIGLSVMACAKFLRGPEFSEEHGLDMTPTQANLFNNTDLTAIREKADML